MFPLWLRHWVRQWYPKKKKSARRRRGNFIRPFVEPLEDRIMLDASLPPDIVVGRTLSSYFVGGIQNNQETITYTVYNEQAQSLTGVLLTDTLAAGEKIESASQQPDQSGQKLAWSLGTIQGFDRASIALTVSLPSPIPSQVDTGAQAFTMLNGASVSNSTPAATLRPGNVNVASLLASTPDANISDPFIQEEAAKLDYDPQKIFDFLHNDIGYNSYLGSMRGARGTLWSSAGNALDMANLGVALMRASGIPAQYVSGTLSKGQAQTLILSMFPASFQTVGYLPAGTQTADPANDPQLLSETESHYWFQFDSGNGMQDADPFMAGAAIGQTFTTSTGIFSEVPDNLREKTAIQLTAETLSELDQVTNSAPDTQVVLDQTFNDVDLVGHPISIGNTVSTNGSSFLQNVYTYTPYLVIGDEAFPDPRTDETIRGTPFQEVNSKVDPEASTALTGLFLNVTLSGPQGPVETFQHTIFDRIGYAARQNPYSLDVSFDPKTPPALTDFDMTTLIVSAALQNVNVMQKESEEAATLQTQLNQASTINGSIAATAQSGPLLANSAIALTGLLAQEISAVSDGLTAELAATSKVTAYFDRPRIIAASQEIIPDNKGTTATVSTAADLVENVIRPVAFPGQANTATANFYFARGFSENAVENLVMTQTISNGASSSAIEIFTAAGQQGIPIEFLSGTDHIATLDSLGLDPNATALITNELQAGQIVLVPQTPVLMDGQKMVAWFQINPHTGFTTDVMPSGGHEEDIFSEETAASLSGMEDIYAGMEVAEIDQLEFQFAFRVALQQKIEQNQMVKMFLQGKKIAEKAESVLNKLKFLGGSIGGLNQIRPIFGLPDPVDTILDATLQQMEYLSQIDPSVFPELLDLRFPSPSPTNVTQNISTINIGSLHEGETNGSTNVPILAAAGQLTLNWSSSSNSAFQLASMSAANGTVTDGNGNKIASGATGLAATSPVNASVSGNNQYSVAGTGSVSFYGPAESNLGVSGNWTNYSATVTGNVSITLTVPGGVLTLKGQTLPAGTYTITTNSATFSGSGPSTSPNFAGSASIAATNGKVNLGSGIGNVTVGGNALDVSSGATLDGYTGSITVGAGGGNNLDNVTLNGNAANVLTVSATPKTLTTDQNTPVTFQANVNTSFADTYNLTAQAPPGWTVTIDSKGNVTATPAPGLQGGAFPIQIIAQSQTNPNLLAQTTVNVSIQPTPASETLKVIKDPLFTVPFHGAQLPTAFQVQIHNNGAAPVTENLAFSNIPSGFTLLDSGTSVTIPAGQTGILGVYLMPNGSQVPAAGTQASCTVTATNAKNSADVQKADESFTVPAVDSVNLAANPPQVSSTPDTPIQTTLSVQNTGNVDESVSLASSGPGDVTVSGLNTVTVQAEQTVNEPITLTPAAKAALNSTRAITITATFGPTANPQTATTEVNVEVVSPPIVALSQAATAASLNSNNSQLAQKLTDLQTAVVQLQAKPTDPAALQRVQLVISDQSPLLSADPALASFVPKLQPIQAKANKGDVTGLLNVLPPFFSSLSSTLSGQASQQFSISLTPQAPPGTTPIVSPGNSAIYVEMQMGQSQAFQVQLVNQGTVSESLTLRTPNLSSGMTASFSKTQVTLAPGATDTETLTLTDTTFANKVFTLEVSAADSVVQHTATAVVAVRRTAADVLGVTVTPQTVSPGSAVTVSAQVFNTANIDRSILAHVDMLDNTGALVKSLTDIPATLVPGTGSQTFNLGQVDTTGLANGIYYLQVSLRGADGTPLPGKAGQAAFEVGLPVTASVAASPPLLLPGTSTVTTTITVANQASAQSHPVFGPPVNLLTSTSAGSVAVGDLNGDGIQDLVVSDGSKIDVLLGKGDGTFDAPLTLPSPGGSYLTLADLTNNGKLDIIAASDSSINVYLNNGHGSFKAPISFDGGFNPGIPVVADFDGDGIPDLAVPTGGPSVLVFKGKGDGTFSQVDDFTNFNYGGGFVRPGQLAVGDFNGNGKLDIAVANAYDYYAGQNELEIMWGNGNGTFQNTTTNYWFGSGGSEVTTADFNHDGRSDLAIVNQELGTVTILLSQANGTLLNAGTFPSGDKSDLQINGSETAGDIVAGDFEGDGTVDLVISNEVAGSHRTQVTAYFLAGNGDGTFKKPIKLDTGGTFAFSLAAADLKKDGNLDLVVGNVGANVSALFPGTTASVVVTNNLPASGYTVDPASISPAPSSSSSSQVQWSALVLQGVNPSKFQVSGTVANMAPGEVRQVSTGSTVAVTTTASTGQKITNTISLPPFTVAAEHIISLSPPVQTAGRNSTVTYTVTLTNPLPTAQTYTLSTEGLDGFQTNLASSVTVAAGKTATTPLTVTVPLLEIPGTEAFEVLAKTAGGASDSVEGQLTVQSQINVPSLAVNMTMAPTKASAGQGGSAVYTLTLTNVGDATDTYTLSGSFPKGVTGSFSQPTIALPPGASNYRDVTLVLTPQVSTATGDDPFTVTATSTTDSSVTATVNGTLTVVNTGVSVTLTPSSAAPGSTFQMKVTNTGSVTDTFHLALAGTGGLVGRLGSSTVTLGANASQTIPISTGAVGFALAGNLPLTAIGTSQANPAVSAAATANLVIPQTTGMTAQFSPASQTINQPGPASTLLLVNTTGNKEDSYTAKIIGTRGPITANLEGLDGLPTQTIPLFRLQGLATGAILLQTVLSGFGEGTVTVQVTSLNNPAITQTVTATITAGLLGDPFNQPDGSPLNSLNWTVEEGNFAF